MRSFSSACALIAFGLLGIQAAQAAPITYTAILNGANESSPNASPGTGTAVVTLDTTLHTLTVDVNFNGLFGNTTASHIHAPTTDPLSGSAGVATQTPSFVGFPLGVTSGSYHMDFDTSQAATWNASYITSNGGTPLGAEAALDLALQSNKAYYNIHTNTYPGGEIRGFLVVPEPSSLALLSFPTIALVLRRRQRTQTL